MFEATLHNGEFFKSIMASVNDFIYIMKWTCSSECISIEGNDSTWFATISISSSAFCNYRCDSKLTKYIFSNKLYKIVSSAGKDDNITFIIDNSNTMVLKYGRKDGVGTSEYEIELWDRENRPDLHIDTRVTTIPNPPIYTTDVSIPASEFTRICKNLYGIGSTMTVRFLKDAIEFTAQDKGYKGNERLNRADGKVEIDIREPISRSLDLQFLNTIEKMSLLSDRVRLCTNRSAPLNIEYLIENTDCIEICRIHLYIRSVDDANS